jgi:23S rRNA (uracil1939-C5)-methyltransferase
MKLGDRLTLNIEKAVAGGRMLARHDGAVALVSAAIPGERVEADIEKIQRGTIWAATRRVIEASPDRVEPFCELDCGGSVYAHVRSERQLALKRDVLRDAFSRLAHVALPDDVTVTPSRADGYRMRARLHARHGRLGFFREGTHELCDPGPTRQLLPDTIAVLEQLERSLVNATRAGVGEVEVSENCDASERALHLHLTADGDPSALAPFTQVEGVNGVSSGAPHHSRALTLWGRPEVTDTLRGVRLKRHACAFFQGNRYLLSTLVSRVVDCVPAGTVLDLYAGVGLFSAVLAARGDVTLTAVEGDPIAAHDLKDNLAAFGAAGARHQPVEVFLSGRVPRPDTVIVDPPRMGMTKQATDGILRLRAPRIVYVSCDVATLARDVRTLTERGYELSGIEAFDMFPNTAHVETLAVLERKRT